MIRVRVELIPHGFGKPQELGELVIANMGTGTPTRGNYRFVVRGKKKRVMSFGKVEKFPRKSRHAWDLVRLCLDEHTLRGKK